VNVRQGSLSRSSAGRAAGGAGQPRLNGQLKLVRPTKWALWERAGRAICYVLVVDLLAVTTVVYTALWTPVRPGDAIWFAVLMGCIVLYTEASRSIERIREHYAKIPHIDLNSVWMFGAVLLLHPALAAAVIATSYGYRWLRVRHHIVFRQTFSAAATILSGYASYIFLIDVGGATFPDMDRSVLSFALASGAAALFQVVNWVFIAIAIGLNAPHSRLRDALMSPADYALESATLALGILLAWALVDWPVALLLIIGITLVLHRNVLIRQLREKARTDPKTGLLNAAGWSTAVDAELARAARAKLPCGLLVIDLDHFKAFNDAYGHLAGDDILRGVANTISAEVRAYDIVGRFGGEEFVVLLPATNDTETVHVAERIRARITSLPLPAPEIQLTVSIGAAIFPHHSETLAELLHTADMAMYSAKASGRNRVHLASTNGTANPKSPHNGSPRSVPIPEPKPHTNGARPTAVEPNIA
jgi:diguanylate cyclase (GGDEF)-like protein